MRARRQGRQAGIARRAADPKARVVDQAHIVDLNFRIAALSSVPAQQRVMDDGLRVADTLQSAANARAQDPLDREQRHLGVVCDGAVQPHVPGQLRNAVREPTADFSERQELDLGSQTVPDGPTQKTRMESDQRQPVMSGVIGH